MPRTSFAARRTRKKTPKTRSTVPKAMTSSILHHSQVPAVMASPVLEAPAPKVERPSARRKMVSMCCRAAVVAGEEDGASLSREMEVEGDGSGMGMWVARNMW